MALIFYSLPTKQINYKNGRGGREVGAVIYTYYMKLQVYYIRA